MNGYFKGNFNAYLYVFEAIRRFLKFTRKPKVFSNGNCAKNVDFWKKNWDHYRKSNVSKSSCPIVLKKRKNVVVDRKIKPQKMLVWHSLKIDYPLIWLELRIFGVFPAINLWVKMTFVTCFCDYVVWNYGNGPDIFMENHGG